MKKTILAFTAAIALISCSENSTSPDIDIPTVESRTISGEVISNGNPSLAKVSLFRSGPTTLARIAEGELPDSTLNEEVATTETDSSGQYVFDEIALADGDTLAISATCLGGSSSGATTIQAKGASTISVKSIECNSSGVINVIFSDTSGALLANDIFRINGKEVHTDGFGLYSSIESEDEYTIGDTLVILPDDTSKFVNAPAIVVLDNIDSSITCDFESCTVNVEFISTLLTLTLPSDISDSLYITRLTHDWQPAPGGDIKVIPTFTTDSTKVYILTLSQDVNYILTSESMTKAYKIDINTGTDYLNLDITGVDGVIHGESDITNWDLNIVILDSTISVNSQTLN